MVKGYVLVAENSKFYVKSITRLDGKFISTTLISDAFVWSSISEILHDLRTLPFRDRENQVNYTIGKISEVVQPELEVTRLD